jgi:3-hydroxyacyl-CoA dehydrogenase
MTPGVTDRSVNSSPPGETAPERVAVVGTGAIGLGLARAAANVDELTVMGEVTVMARSEEGAARAAEALAGEGRVVGDVAELAGATLVVEAVAENFDLKHRTHAAIDAVLDDDAVLASTTSALPIAELAARCGRPDRFGALHVFNPVEKMALVELCLPISAAPPTGERLRRFAEALGKTVVEVPDAPGFVVNRLLFPFLFAAVRLQAEHDLPAEDVDRCMKLGAGHPMGPLALLDFVGMDIAVAIGEAIGEPVPERLRAMVESGALGRKAGRGFYDYREAAAAR